MLLRAPLPCTLLKYVVVYTPANNAYSNTTETTLPLSPPLSCYWCFISGCFLTGLQPQPQQAVGSAANNYSTNLTSLTSSLSSLGVSAGSHYTCIACTLNNYALIIRSYYIIFPPVNVTDSHTVYIHKYSPYRCAKNTATPQPERIVEFPCSLLPPPIRSLSVFYLYSVHLSSFQRKNEEP
ncbi:hypothetical protein QTP88_015101 [Uroleucon formosanum]